MPSVSSGKVKVDFGNGLPTLRIGERINPTGKPHIQDLLKKGHLGWIDELAIEQERGGANVIGINVGIAGIDESELLVNAVKRVAEKSPLPIYIDSSHKDALLKAVEFYPYVPLVGSATGEEKSYKEFLDYLKELNIPLVVVLNNEKGVPRKATQRIKIAEKILSYAEQTGFSIENLVFDCIAMTVGEDPDACMETIECINVLSRNLGCSTIIGVSNASFGLPQRRVFSRVFVSMAVLSGVSAVIYNPNSLEMTETILAADVLTRRDQFATRYLDFYRKALASSI
ncbi:MAG: dihydropteroate synthase [Deltaproteobacteria bacterium]|nr:dihydropteroate synthase [Deltaproteobacteria bacterium]